MFGDAGTAVGSSVTQQVVASPGADVRADCKASLSFFGTETTIMRPKWLPSFTARKKEEKTKHVIKMNIYAAAMNSSI